jgi:hypothetical protein
VGFELIIGLFGEIDVIEHGGKLVDGVVPAFNSELLEHKFLAIF